MRNKVQHAWAAIHIQTLSRLVYQWGENKLFVWRNSITWSDLGLITTSTVYLWMGLSAHMRSDIVWKLEGQSLDQFHSFCNGCLQVTQSVTEHLSLFSRHIFTKRHHLSHPFVNRYHKSSPGGWGARSHRRRCDFTAEMLHTLCVCYAQWVQCPRSPHQTVNKTVSRTRSRFSCVIYSQPPLYPFLLPTQRSFENIYFSSRPHFIMSFFLNPFLPQSPLCLPTFSTTCASSLVRPSEWPTGIEYQHLEKERRLSSNGGNIVLFKYFKFLCCA